MSNTGRTQELPLRYKDPWLALPVKIVAQRFALSRSKVHWFADHISLVAIQGIKLQPF